MELFIHVMMLIGGLAVWAALLLILSAIIFIIITTAAEVLRGRQYSLHIPWVRKLRIFLLTLWLVVAVITSAYYGIRVDVQLNSPVWEEKFYEGVRDNG